METALAAFPAVYVSAVMLVDLQQDLCVCLCDFRPICLKKSESVVDPGGSLDIFAHASTSFRMLASCTSLHCYQCGKFTLMSGDISLGNLLHDNQFQRVQGLLIQQLPGHQHDPWVMLQNCQHQLLQCWHTHVVNCFLHNRAWRNINIVVIAVVYRLTLWKYFKVIWLLGYFIGLMKKCRMSIKGS